MLCCVMLCYVMLLYVKGANIYPYILNQRTGVYKNRSESNLCVQAAMIFASLCIGGRCVEMI